MTIFVLEFIIYFDLDGADEYDQNDFKQKRISQLPQAWWGCAGITIVSPD